MAFTERYVTQGAGGGGAGTEGDPWTLAEALTNAAAGDRVNIQSDAGYSLGADAVSNAGTIVSYICFRGYNSSIGDLDIQGRNSDGSLNTTNFPVITLTGTLTGNNFIIFQNLYFTGALSATLLGGTTTDLSTIMSCKFENTQSNASAACISGDNQIQLVNSEFICSATTHGIVIDLDDSAMVIGCRIKGNSNSTAILLRINFGIIEGCFIHGGSSTLGIVQNHGNLTQIIGTTIYGIGTAIQLPNVAFFVSTLLVNNHITDCSKYLDSLYVGTANTTVQEIYNRTRDNTTPRTGISDESLRVGEVTTDTGGASTDYVDAPNGDITLIPAAPGVDAGMGM